MAETAMGILPLELYFSLKTTLVFNVDIVEQKNKSNRKLYFLPLQF